MQGGTLKNNMVFRHAHSKECNRNTLDVTLKLYTLTQPFAAHPPASQGVPELFFLYNSIIQNIVPDNIGIMPV